MWIHQVQGNVDVEGCKRRVHQRKRSTDATLLYFIFTFSSVCLSASDKQYSFCASAFQVPLNDFAILGSRSLKYPQLTASSGKTVLLSREQNVEGQIQSVSVSDISVTTTRRRAIHSMTAVSIALIPSIAAAASPTARQLFGADSLERCGLGGQWGQLERSILEPSNLRSVRIPAAFCTYLTRFLIRYDKEGVAEWWKQQEFTYSLLPQSVRDSKLNGLFGMISKSVERAVQRYIGEDEPMDRYTTLWDFLHETYRNEPDAKRHIAILFSFLPIDQQPTTRLQEYYESLDRKLLYSSGLEEKSEYSIRYSISDDLTQLLPSHYQIACTKTNMSNLNSKLHFTTEPKIALYKVGVPDKLEQTTLVTVFGPMGAQPLIRQRPNYSVNVYSLLGLAGASGCALTHTVVIPLDVVKTRAQTDPSIIMKTNNDETSVSSSSIGIFDAGMRIVEKEGVSGLFLGAQATLVGYCWYGLSVYPSYTFLKRYLTQDVLSIDYATSIPNEIALLAGALAAVIASLGLTPLEAARIRVVAEPQTYRSLGLSGTLKVIAQENPSTGWKNLYAGLPSLLTRQVIFGSVKFLAFERACELIFFTLPFLHESTWTELAVSLVAGGFSGVLSSVVSQPADSVLTYVARNKSSSGNGNLGIFESVRTMVTEEGVGSLFRGLGSRCVWAGSIIAGQFLLYDIARSLFRVTPIDLSQIYEITFSAGAA